MKKMVLISQIPTYGSMENSNQILVFGLKMLDNINNYELRQNWTMIE
jgi:hypothetical protein